MVSSAASFTSPRACFMLPLASSISLPVTLPLISWALPVTLSVVPAMIVISFRACALGGRLIAPRSSNRKARAVPRFQKGSGGGREGHHKVIGFTSPTPVVCYASNRGGGREAAPRVSVQVDGDLGAGLAWGADGGIAHACRPDQRAGGAAARPL